MLFQGSNQCGYRTVHVVRMDGTKTPIQVHILVALTFIGEPPSFEHEVNHKDLDKQNNCDWNLEWLTHLENMRHYFANGYDPKCRQGKQRGEKNPRATLTKEQVDIILQTYSGRYGEQVAFAKQFGVSPIAVNHVLRRRSWSWVEYVSKTWRSKVHDYLLRIKSVERFGDVQF